jgi:hypothetical protein
MFVKIIVLFIVWVIILKCSKIIQLYTRWKLINISCIYGISFQASAHLYSLQTRYIVQATAAVFSQIKRNHKIWLGWKLIPNYTMSTKINSAWTLRFEPIRRSQFTVKYNSIELWKDILLSIYYTRILSQIEFYNFAWF